MKIFEILFFIANIITIYSTKAPQDTTSLSQSTTSVDEGISRKLETNCPHVWKIIHDRNLTEYTVDCKSSNTKSGVVNEENVLQQACFVVKNMLFFICDRKLKVKPELFKLGNNLGNGTSPCPFNFSHIVHLDVKLSDHDSVVRELTGKDHCSKVCEDLYEIRTQCAVLSQLINYLKGQLSVEQDVAPLEEGKTKPELDAFTVQKTEMSFASQKQEEEQQTARIKAKEITSRPKNETSLDKLEGTSKNITKLMKEQKTEKMTSALKEQEIPKVESKVTDSDSIIPQEDFKPALEDQNEDLVNEDSVNLIADSLSDKSDMDKMEKIPASHLNGKEIYPAEGFFQAEDSHFFFYFIMVSSVIVVGYLAFHNKNKILAYALEGANARRSRRRPNPARYRKLEANLEEAISSSATSSAVSNVVY